MIHENRMSSDCGIAYVFVRMGMRCFCAHCTVYIKDVRDVMKLQSNPPPHHDHTCFYGSEWIVADAS